jgi:hypothetical protein
MTHAKYVGSDEKYIGHSAIIRPGGCAAIVLVQFDVNPDTERRFDLDWHEFASSDWEIEESPFASEENP